MSTEKDMTKENIIENLASDALKISKMFKAYDGSEEHLKKLNEMFTVAQKTYGTLLDGKCDRYKIFLEEVKKMIIARHQAIQQCRVLLKKLESGEFEKEIYKEYSKLLLLSFTPIQSEDDVIAMTDNISHLYKDLTETNNVYKKRIKNYLLSEIGEVERQWKEKKGESE